MSLNHLKKGPCIWRQRDGGKTSKRSGGKVNKKSGAWVSHLGAVWVGIFNSHLPQVGFEALPSRGITFGNACMFCRSSGPVTQLHHHAEQAWRLQSAQPSQQPKRAVSATNRNNSFDLLDISQQTSHFGAFLHKREASCCSITLLLIAFWMQTSAAFISV